jgi:hypothetical protein
MKESELSPSADFLKRGKRVRRDALLTVDKPSRLTFRAAERRTPNAKRQTLNAARYCSGKITVESLPLASSKRSSVF